MSTPNADASNDSVPMCPVRGKMMVLRTHRSGPQCGQLYYGYMDDPHCLGSMPISKQNSG